MHSATLLTSVSKGVLAFRLGVALVIASSPALVPRYLDWIKQRIVRRVYEDARPPPGSSQELWGVSHLNNVSGRPAVSFVTSEQIELLRNGSFDHRRDDLWVVTYPKSGTTWAMTIVAKLLGHRINGLFEWYQKSYCPWPERGLGDPLMLKMEEYKAMKGPRCLKSHWPAIDHMAVPGRGKALLVMRNVQDVAVSYFKHYHDVPLLFDFEEGTWDEFFDLFAAGDVGSGNYFEYIASWWPHRHDPNVLLLRYEELKQDPAGHIRKIAEFMELGELSEARVQEVQEFTSLENMKVLEDTWLQRYMLWVGIRRGSHVRKGETGRNRHFFTDEQLAVLEEQYDRILKPLGVPVEWVLPGPRVSEAVVSS